MKLRESEPRVDEALPQPLTPRGQRVRVRIVGQQYSLVELHGPRELVPDGARRAALEGVHVDPRPVRQPSDAAIQRGEIRAGDAPQIVERAVEVVRARVEAL